MRDLLLRIHKCPFTIAIDVFIRRLAAATFRVHYGSETFAFHRAFLFYNIKYICSVGDIHGAVSCGAVGKYRDGTH